MAKAVQSAAAGRGVAPLGSGPRLQHGTSSKPFPKLDVGRNTIAARASKAKGIQYAPAVVNGRNQWQQMYDAHLARLASKQADATGEVGLSYFYNPPQAEITLSSRVAIGKKFVDQPRVHMAVGGNFLKLRGRRISRDVVSNKPRGVRRISEFTMASRRHLMNLCRMIDQNRLDHLLPLFVTLTYPATWPNDPTEWKRHLELFGKRLRRLFPRAFMLWRLEPQKRGAPHYHLIVFNVRFLDHAIVARWWADIVNSEHYEKHLLAGVEVKRVRSWGGVMHYAAKYTAKISPKLADDVYWPKHVGRWWGVMGYAMLNECLSLYERAVNPLEFYTLRRYIRRYLKSRGVSSKVGKYSGLTAYTSTETGDRWLNPEPPEPDPYIDGRWLLRRFEAKYM